jgi:hypothetical protein
MYENRYQAELIKDLEDMFPNCVVMKQDSSYRQGIPDLLILYLDRWAMLEVKISEDADEQPNQPYYVDMFNNMSFAAFIYPEIEELVLRDLREHFYR